MTVTWQLKVLKWSMWKCLQGNTIINLLKNRKQFFKNFDMFKILLQTEGHWILIQKSKIVKTVSLNNKFHIYSISQGYYWNLRTIYKIFQINKNLHFSFFFALFFSVLRISNYKEIVCIINGFNNYYLLKTIIKHNFNWTWWWPNKYKSFWIIFLLY